MWAGTAEVAKRCPMRTIALRFSLLSLMGAVLVTAVACASLRYASPLWASAVFTLVILILSLTTAGALCASQDARKFCIGFSVIGWIYVCWSFGLLARCQEP